MWWGVGILGFILFITILFTPGPDDAQERTRVAVRVRDLLPDPVADRRGHAARRAEPQRRLGGFAEIWSEPPGRTARPDAGSSVAPVMAITGAPCVCGLGTTIAPRRRATFRQTLLAGQAAGDLAAVVLPTRRGVDLRHDAGAVAGLDRVAHRGRPRQLHVLEVFPAGALDRDGEALHAPIIAARAPQGIFGRISGRARACARRQRGRRGHVRAPTSRRLRPACAREGSARPRSSAARA
jgi:hypothetical protein